ncbi:carbohydrate kinase [Punctularia strigosozonata HHB-11173 SS5]|uniref:carbohydrate kinase n=1 Tax=Punctularia strigosozonata (strain HHB-11173) TaxID=741275 RepID=UPI0004417A98|nr:carbohydrate kinase [Punctularia strigosozonata HHB-11173 SS5]EIN13946.1 carbohydrate kinase [Punctularia strigosozonata HHB-11173 SS5]
MSSELSTPMLVIVMGVSGCGKSTLAEALAKALGFSYIDADAIHPKSNVDKMSAGIPLTDADRDPWLKLVRAAAEHAVAEQQSDPDHSRRRGAVVACSALKRYYRDILRGTRHPETLKAPVDPPNPEALPTYFVYIKGDRTLLEQRMSLRRNHFMKASMLDSQLATLESPEGEDGVAVVPLDASTDEQVALAMQQLMEFSGS